MKVYVEPKQFWTNGYNVFDVIILVVSLVPTFVGDNLADSLTSLRIVRACRSLRVLKTVSFIRGLQVNGTRYFGVGYYLGFFMI